MLNFGQSFVTDADEKISVARFNYQAGLRAKSTAAFGPALMYMQKADELLCEDLWKIDYQFMFGIHKPYFMYDHKFSLITRSV